MLLVERSCVFMQVPFSNDLRRVMFVGTEWPFLFLTHTCTHLTTEKINPNVYWSHVHTISQMTLKSLEVSLCT